MAIINLKEFYPWYTHDEYIEVSDEVAAELRADKLYEAAHQRRIVRNKAQYSLDCNDGIEYSACLHEPTPQELLERMDQFCTLWNALNTLPEIQHRKWGIATPRPRSGVDRLAACPDRPPHPSGSVMSSIAVL